MEALLVMFGIVIFAGIIAVVIFAVQDKREHLKHS